MKLGLIGDTHFTNKNPVRRKDDYFATQINKFNQILDIFNEYNVDIIIQTGDLVDNPNVSNAVISEIIRTLRNRNKTVLSTYGQHDISSHSSLTLNSSPLSVIQAAGFLEVLDGDEYYPTGHGIRIYGSGFGSKIPTPTGNMYNVLIIHAMIGDRELYPGQELQNPTRFLKNNPGYNLVVAGDYHYRFSTSIDGRFIINPGCMVRKSISEHDLSHEPAVCIFDTDTSKLDIIKLKVSPVDEIFDMTRNETRDNQYLMKLVNALMEKQTKKGIPQWRSTLVDVMNKHGANDRTRSIIDSVLEEIHEHH